MHMRGFLGLISTIFSKQSSLCHLVVGQVYSHEVVEMVAVPYRAKIPPAGEPFAATRALLLGDRLSHLPLQSYGESFDMFPRGATRLAPFPIAARACGAPERNQPVQMGRARCQCVERQLLLTRDFDGDRVNDRLDRRLETRLVMGRSLATPNRKSLIRRLQSRATLDVSLRVILSP
jgi:hypothetical protein